MSHVGIAVRDVDRSVAFYEGLLGFTLIDRFINPVTTDPEEAERRAADEGRGREAAILRAGPHPDDPTVVLTFPKRDADREVELDDVGVHHLGFWVDDIDAVARRLEAAGTPFILKPQEFSARGWGRPESESMRTCLVRDPDGTIIQLDELVG